MHPNLSLSDAETIIEERPFASLGDANKAIKQTLDENASEAVKKIIDIKSNYFLLKSNININDTHLQAQTLFKREGQAKTKILRIIERSYQQVLKNK